MTRDQVIRVMKIGEDQITGDNIYRSPNDIKLIFLGSSRLIDIDNYTDLTTGVVNISFEYDNELIRAIPREGTTRAGCNEFYKFSQIEGIILNPDAVIL
jgi:hypothetical protein